MRLPMTNGTLQNLLSVSVMVFKCINVFELKPCIDAVSEHDKCYLIVGRKKLLFSTFAARYAYTSVFIRITYAQS